MFPRPSRFLRLLIILSLLMFITISMYLIHFDNSERDTELSEALKFRMATLDYNIVGSRLSSGGRRGQQTMADGVLRYREALQEDSVVHFDHYVLQKLTQGGMLSQESRIPSGKRGAINITSFGVNPHNFNYIHNPSTLCERNNITLLIYIHSHPKNLKKRQAVRQTWGHPRLLRLYNASIIFVLGRVLDATVQSLIDMEAHHYGDILQEDFVDSYRNLTYKGVAGLKWAGIFCRRSHFMLKTDDDILVDVVSLMERLYTVILPTRKSRLKLVLCNVWTRMKVIRDPKSKWYISKEEFSDEYFPAYCSGSAFLLSADLVPVLYETALQTPFFWVDDYYVTGMLVNKLKVPHTRFNSAYLLNYNVAEEKLKNDSKELLVFHVKKLSLFLKLWPILMHRHWGMEEYLQPVNIGGQNVSSAWRHVTIDMSRRSKAAPANDESVSSRFLASPADLLGRLTNF